VISLRTLAIAVLGSCSIALSMPALAEVEGADSETSTGSATGNPAVNADPAAEDGDAAGQESKEETQEGTEPEEEVLSEMERRHRARLHRKLDRASDFAPAGVMLDHTHEKGDWTFSYRYMRLAKEDLLDGSSRANPLSLAGFQTLPTSQTENRHFFGVMYAPRDRFTFAIMLPYIQRDLQVVNSGIPLEVETTGIGDTQLIFLIPFIQKGDERSHLKLGVSAPTGSIQEEQPNGQRLPYTMQLGSGSWEILWGITYTGQYKWLSWGSQFESLYRLNDNYIGYRLGTTYDASLWVTGGLGDWLSASVRIAWHKVNNIHDVDPSLDKTLSPLNDNMKQGATRLEIGPGLNFLLPFAGGQRLAVEAGFPFWQTVDGPQLGTELTVTASWQWIF